MACAQELLWASRLSPSTLLQRIHHSSIGRAASLLAMLALFVSTLAAGFFPLRWGRLWSMPWHKWNDTAILDAWRFGVHVSDSGYDNVSLHDFASEPCGCWSQFPTLSRSGTPIPTFDLTLWWPFTFKMENGNCRELVAVCVLCVEHVHWICWKMKWNLIFVSDARHFEMWAMSFHVRTQKCCVRDGVTGWQSSLLKQLVDEKPLAELHELEMERFTLLLCRC